VAQRMRNKAIAAAVIVWKEGLDEQKNRERGERIMMRVGKRMMNREASDAVMGWREQQLEEKNRLRGEAIMRRVGGRMRHKEVVLNWQEWHRNYKADVAGMWMNRWSRIQQELESVHLQHILDTHANAESIMRNIAKRMLNKEVAFALIIWSEKLRVHNAHQCALRITKRVMMRMRHRSLSDAVMGWHERQLEEHRLLTDVNTLERSDMFRERCGRLQKELESARMSLIEKSQNSGAGMMKAIAGRLRSREACDAIAQWRHTHFSWKRKERARRIMRRAIGHTWHTEISHGFRDWHTHFVVDMISACGKLQREIKRAELQSEKELNEISARLKATARTAHSGVMRNVVQRLKHRQLVPAVFVWRQNVKDEQLQQRASRIVKRVVRRMMHMAATSVIFNWSQNLQKELQEKQGNTIMRYTTEVHKSQVLKRDLDLERKWSDRVIKKLVKIHVQGIEESKKFKACLNWNHAWRRHQDVADLHRLMAYVDTKRI